MADNKEQEVQPPYISFITVKNFVASLRATGLPDRIDRSLIVGQSGGTQSYLLSAMRFFGLMDGSNKPTPRLQALAENPDDEAKTWNEAVRDGYDFLFDGGFNIETATDSQLSDKFKDKGLNGATIRKCMSCFAAACEAAAIKISPHLKAGKRSGGSPSNGGVKRVKRKKSANSPPPAASGHHDQPPPAVGHTKAFLHLNPEGTRVFKIEAPPTVTKEELARITSWLSFQLIVAPTPKAEDLFDDL